jgi:hypothetical protein
MSEVLGGPRQARMPLIPSVFIFRSADTGEARSSELPVRSFADRSERCRGFNE